MNRSGLLKKLIETYKGDIKVQFTHDNLCNSIILNTVLARGATKQQSTKSNKLTIFSHHFGPYDLPKKYQPNFGMFEGLPWLVHEIFFSHL